MPQEDQYLSKHRLDALSDGVYAIAITLLVLELKLPALAHPVSDHGLREALMELLPKGLVWLLSFYVMAVFWLAQQRLHRFTAAVSKGLGRIELVHLALISLLPFSTALIGEYGNLPTAAAIYSGHLLLLSMVSLARVGHVARHKALQAADLDPAWLKQLSPRAMAAAACSLAALVLAFFIPGWNMFAMLPLLLVPWASRAAGAPSR